MKKIIAAVLIILVIVGGYISTHPSIDRTLEDELNGVYRIMSDSENNGYWGLFIGDTNSKFSLSLYDAEAGNPGVEGKVTYLDETTIKIKVDPDYYEELPSGKWECDGKTLELAYEMTPYGIILTNNGDSVEFGRESSLATRLKTEKCPGIESIEFRDGKLIMTGSVFFENDDWKDGTFEYVVPDGFEFADWALGHDQMNAKEFVKFVKSDEAKGLVIEISANGDELSSCGVCEQNASMLSEECGE